MSTKAPTLRAFHKRFPTEDSCLDHLMRTRFGERFVCFKCLKESRYYRVKSRRCFECERCGYQVYPTAGTPFEKTRTSLRDWFLVMFLFTTSRNGVAAKEVQRQIGVTYKTAWRMCREIRKYMGYVDGDHTLGGDGGTGVVELDHTFVGGRDRMGHDDKAIVLGMIEREGDVITRVVPAQDHFEVTPHLYKFVTKSAEVMTDEARAFRAACAIYQHATVNHEQKEWARGRVHTNNIEAFWAVVQRSIAGTYISVSKKHLQKYLWEFEFRQNLRKVPHLMFDLLLASFPKVRVEP
ncbi:MAG TPA: IS1595 family transposase [Beijerinckiaceae bacterium]